MPDLRPMVGAQVIDEGAEIIILCPLGKAFCDQRMGIEIGVNSQGKVGEGTLILAVDEAESPCPA